MIRRPPRSTLDRSSAASDVYKRQDRSRRRGRVGGCACQSHHFTGEARLAIPQADRHQPRVGAGHPDRAHRCLVKFTDRDHASSFLLGTRRTRRGRHGESALFSVSSAFPTIASVSYTHLRAHETVLDLVCRLLLEKKHRIRHNLTTNFHINDQTM